MDVEVHLKARSVEGKRGVLSLKNHNKPSVVKSEASCWFIYFDETSVSHDSSHGAKNVPVLKNNDLLLKYNLMLNGQLAFNAKLEFFGSISDSFPFASSYFIRISWSLTGKRMSISLWSLLSLRDSFESLDKHISMHCVDASCQLSLFWILFWSQTLR